MNNIDGRRGAEHRATLPASWRPAQFCHRESPFLTQVEGIRRLPHSEDRGAGLRLVPQHPGQTQQNPPNNDVNAGFVATNAYLATNSTLGPAVVRRRAERDAATARAPDDVDLDRRNELDLRFGKMLRMGTGTRASSAWISTTHINSTRSVNVNQSFATVPRADSRS